MSDLLAHAAEALYETLACHNFAMNGVACAQHRSDWLADAMEALHVFADAIDQLDARDTYGHMEKVGALYDEIAVEQKRLKEEALRELEWD